MVIFPHCDLIGQICGPLIGLEALENILWKSGHRQKQDQSFSLNPIGCSSGMKTFPHTMPHHHTQLNWENSKSQSS